MPGSSSSRPRVAPPATRFGGGAAAQAQSGPSVTRSARTVPPPPTRFGGAVAAQPRATLPPPVRLAPPQPVQRAVAPAHPVRRVIQRVQDLSVYEIEQGWIVHAIKAIQSVLSDKGAIAHWIGWLNAQVDEIFGRLKVLKHSSDDWISVYTDHPRGEETGTALRRWKEKKAKALDIALWRIERRWMRGTPSRQTVTAALGDRADEFVKEALKGGALKDVGAPLLHGEYPHRIQWYVIYRHLTFQVGLNDGQIYRVYRELLDPKHIRYLQGNTLVTSRDYIGDDKEKPFQGRSLWDRVVDIRLSERESTGVGGAYWASPLAVTASLTTGGVPRNAPKDLERFKGSVTDVVEDRLAKRTGQKNEKSRYNDSSSSIDTEQLNLGRQLVNVSLAEKLNLY